MMKHDVAAPVVVTIVRSSSARAEASIVSHGLGPAAGAQDKPETLRFTAGERCKAQFWNLGHPHAETIRDPAEVTLRPSADT